MNTLGMEACEEDESLQPHSWVRDRDIFFPCLLSVVRRGISLKSRTTGSRDGAAVSFENSWHELELSSLLLQQEKQHEYDAQHDT